MAARARVVVLAALLVVAGCATVRTPFPAGPAGGTVFHAYRQPQGTGPFPAVVLLHTCGGMRGGHTVRWAERLAAEGYAAAVIDSFTPRGGATCSIPYFPASLDQVADDAQAALEHLRTRPEIDPRRIAVMGFSYGASASLRLASPRYHGGVRRFQAAVAWYPLCAPYPGSSPERSDNLWGDIDTPTLILMGENDTDTPSVVTNCVNGVQRLRRAGRPVGINLYAGAGHVFDAGATLHRDALTQATADMLRFLREHLGLRASTR